MKKCFKKNGITLIALIISVLILLILAGVSLQLAVGEDGIIGKAISAREQHEAAEEIEMIELAVARAEVEGEGILNTEILNNALKEQFGNEKKVTSVDSNWIYKIKKNYIIYNNGKVKQIDIQPVEYLEAIDGINTTKILVENENGINSKNLYIEAELIYVPNKIYDFNNRTCFFFAGTYQKCCTSFYRQSTQYVAIYSGNAGTFPTVINNNIIENKIAYITSNYARIDNIQIDISKTTNAEDVYHTFTIASGIGKFGYVNIYETTDNGNNILRHKLIPAIDNNNKPCMYDIINNKALYNTGNGEYIAGPEV